VSIQTKWKPGDKVWWTSHQWRTIFQLYVFQTIVIQVDDGEPKVRYRLQAREQLGDKEHVSTADLPELFRTLEDEFVIEDKDLFETREEALDCLIAGIREEIKQHRKTADYLEEEIPRIINRHLPTNKEN
jgi:hypothetical protein